MRESDDDAVKRARIFVDTRQGCDGSGDLGQPLASGLIILQTIEADLFELCQEASAFRRKPSDITLYKNVGGAHLDLFTARHLLKIAA